MLNLLDISGIGSCGGRGIIHSLQAWDPRLNGRIAKLNVPIEMIWTPDIILYNNAASEYRNEMVMQ